MPAKPKKIPLALQVVIGFLFVLSLCQLTLLLGMCVSAQELDRRLLTQVMLRGLLSLLCLLLGIQLLLRIPFARTCTLVLLVSLPGAKAAHYAIAPLAWQIATTEGRIHELISAAVFLFIAFLLLNGAVGSYLRTADADEKDDPT